MKPNLIIDKSGKFKVENVDKLSYLYFPLTNYKSLKSSITPLLGGSANIDQNTFALTPASNEDYHNSLMNRNLYLRINNEYTWSITGNTAYQLLNRDKVDMEGDFLAHKVIRKNQSIKAVIESFVPFEDVYQELTRITLTNISDEDLIIKPVINIPIYSRSADNIRDHRHVTSLLNNAIIFENGIINQPTFSFDERGHNVNDIKYAVFVNNSNNLNVSKYWPVLQDFIGEGNSLLNPHVVENDLISSYSVGSKVSGYELTGGFEYEEIILKPNQNIDFLLSIMIDKNIDNILIENNNLSLEKYSNKRTKTLISWKKELSNLQFNFSDDRYNGWLKWVTIQPILRRIYGNSFLPHHDYGRGGRGWRDLWQDSLALILMSPEQVRSNLLNNFSGVRIDGSNATIIGDKQGEFLADRNNIARVWMDHGSWPLITTMLYVNKSGDVDFLLEKQNYFNDKFSHYTKKINEKYNDSNNLLKDKNGQIYLGSVLEHLLIQNLIPFYNVGEHNNIRIEDADWNDALDMASKKGESVAFTSLYASNLIELGKVLIELNKRGIEKVELLEEIDILLKEYNFKNIKLKKEILVNYFDIVEGKVSGITKFYSSQDLAELLIKKGEDLRVHVRENEWLEGSNGSWFNGYYDGDGNRLESVENQMMTLTGQVFAIYGETATNKQICKIIESADKYLYDKNVGGYKLNTDFKELKLNMGRLFGFAYGHKENGAMFSHMSVMYANALYRRGFVHAGHKVLNEIYEHCQDIDKAKIYPGIPEYIDPKGRGMYPYLTGSASWYILTEVLEVFGIKSKFGNLELEPKLVKEQFDKNHKASIKTLISNNLVEVIYTNYSNLDYGDYKIKQIKFDGKIIDFTELGRKALINKKVTSNLIEVTLDK